MKAAQRIGWTCALAALVASSGAAALPQDARAEDGPTQPPTEALVLVEERARDVLHPGDPLVVVGLGDEGAGNDFRAGLRAAARGEYRPASVDRGEEYARRIAMLEGGVRFDRAPARVVAAPAEPTAERAPREEEPPPRAPYDTTWVGLLLAAGATVALYVTRGR